MKKLFKPLLGAVAIGALSLYINTDATVLANDIETTCEYDVGAKINPNYSTMNCLLTETALKYDVPPEIVKAIAEGESGNWRHFDNNGETIVTADNGIGIMQITNKSGYDQEKLKSDIVYNIQAGVKTLDEMFKRKDLPRINGGERDVLEHWYFAIMAYNGTKPVNSPIVQATGETNTRAYQEKILRILEKLELINLKKLPFSSDQFQYDTNDKGNIKFLVSNYESKLPLTKSKYFYEANQTVQATTKVTVRSKPTTDSPSLGSLNKGENVIITGPFEYEQVFTKKNHFVWYPMQRNDGTKGYVASSYLDYATSAPTPPMVTTPDYSAYTKKFADFSTTAWWRDDMIWAIDKGLISGYGNVWSAKKKKFETLLKPNAQLTEAHFLTIFFRFAKKDELNSVKNPSAWNKSGLYSMAKKYNMPVLANEKSAASKALADQGIKRGKLAQLMASYDSGKAVSQKQGIEFFMANGLTTATSIDDFEPGKTLTRSQISAFIKRYESLNKSKNN